MIKRTASICVLLLLMISGLWAGGWNNTLMGIRALGIAAALGLAASVFCSLWLRRAWGDCSGEEYIVQIARVEQIFRVLQVGTACYVAFAHGANDVANAVGPLAGIYTAIKMEAVHTQVAVPLWILAVGAVGIVIGLSTWGLKVIVTVGEKIT